MSAEELIGRLDALWLDMNDAVAEPPATARILNALHDAAQALRTPPAPMEAVAWRYRQTSQPEAWAVSLQDMSDWTNLTVQPLYTHTTPIKPSADTGELRERVARRVCRIVRTWQEFKATPEYTFDMEVENAWDDWLSEADTILDLIQSERVHR